MPAQFFSESLIYPQVSFCREGFYMFAVPFFASTAVKQPHNLFAMSPPEPRTLPQETLVHFWDLSVPPPLPVPSLFHPNDCSSWLLIDTVCLMKVLTVFLKNNRSHTSWFWAKDRLFLFLICLQYPWQVSRLICQVFWCIFCASFHGTCSFGFLLTN